MLDLVEGGILRVHLVFGQLCLQFNCKLVHIQIIVNVNIYLTFTSIDKNQ